MKLEIGKNYSGFILKDEDNIKEINSIGRLFIHEKSGARLYSLENDDDNKVFSVSFRTPVYNSTGVPHIIEHSVLCGSKKFPVKEPFVELAKGSLNTFLNAMTFADKTMYPIASKNDKDFYNLMDVYMDAVLNPNIYKYKEIFMQEGWHYELESPESDLKYKGVVYNEMKGAFSSPESLLGSKIQESLFPDTNYSNESGGDPKYIPTLSYEDFLNFHKKYYHPSNSYIYLYGNGNLLEQLSFINDNYLKYYDAQNIDSSISIQKPFGGMRELTEAYSISSNESDIDKTFMSMNFVTGLSIDEELYLAFDILEYMLLETPAAPLKRALLDNKIGKDVFGSFDNSIKQTVFSIIVKNTNVDKKDDFKHMVFDTLKELVHQGIDKKLIEASINYKEFKLREADYHGMPKGLIYNIRAMDSWLYDDKPQAHLSYENALNKIKSALNTNYFESLIEKYILNCNHASLVILKPEKGLSERIEKEIDVKLKNYKKSLNSKEINSIIEDTLRLKERQMSRDSLGDLKTIPLLTLKDLSSKVEKLPVELKESKENKVLFHSMFTNKIAYINLYFDLTTIPEEMLPYAGLLSAILQKVATEKYSYSELSNEININTGGLRFSTETFANNNSPNEHYPKFVLKSKALYEKIPELIELLIEILKNSKFDDKNRIKEIIMELKSRIEMVMIESGHIIAANRLVSYFSKSGKFTENIMGLTFYKFIANLEKNYDEMSEEIYEKLSYVYNTLFNKNNLIISITCEEQEYNNIRNKMNDFLDSMSSTKCKNYNYEFKSDLKNEGLLTTAKIQFVAKGCNFIDLGYKYNGAMAVLKTILSLDYLWNKVRVEGGAYGCFAGFQLSGNMYFVSYRDPNLRETIDVYDSCAEYIKNFDADEREITKYIIGTISRLDFPMTPSMKAVQSDEDFIRGITYEDLQREREEVLSTTKYDIRKFADLIGDAMNKNYICVVGEGTRLRQDKELFNKLIEVFE